MSGAHDEMVNGAKYLEELAVITSLLPSEPAA